MKITADPSINDVLRDENDQRERPAWWDHPRLFAWLVFVVAMALVTVAGVASLPGCASPAQANDLVGTADARIADLRAREAALPDKSTPTAAMLRATRERLEAQTAAVRAAAADNAPSPTEAAAGTAAALIPGGVGVGITAAIGIIGHLVRSRTLAQRVSELQATLEHADDTTDTIVQSIEFAKETNPAFAAEFAKSAPMIRSRQTAAARHKVKASQVRRMATLAQGIKAGAIQDVPPLIGMGGNFPATPTASPHAQAASA